MNDLLARVIQENSVFGRSVEGRNLHLTLKFLGEIREVERIRKSLEEIRFERFTVTLRGMGAFPSLNNGRVLFVRAYPEDILKSLASEVDAKTREIPLDHPFTPHLTLLRVKDRRNFSDVVARYENTTFLEQEISSFSMFESILRPTGPIYKEIQPYQLM
jgi:2'-5' RNA ligase